MAQRFERYINPVLKTLKELEGSARPRQVYDKVAEDLQVPDSVLDQIHKSGVPVYENDIAWARNWLVKVGYIDKSRRGVWSLTEKGRTMEKLSETTIRELMRNTQQTTSGKSSASEETTTSANAIDDELPPDDESDSSYRQDLLDLLAALPPAGFERLSRRLLLEAGFEDVTVEGRSGDGGIDGFGVLKVNPFVKFKVLFQCKRWKGSVGPSQVRDFRGAMMGRADKGLFLTTGNFSQAARDEAARDGVPPIELIDGEELIELFEQLELGLIPRATYDIDKDFFREFQEYNSPNSSFPLAR